MARGKCKGTNDAGEPCESPFAGDDGWCPAHRPGGSERMAEIGRKGAQATAKKLRGGGIQPDELPELEDHEDAKKRLDLICQAVLTGRISDRIAQAAIRAISEWVRAHEGELTALVVDELQAEVERLQGELEGRRRPRLRATE